MVAKVLSFINKFRKKPQRKKVTMLDAYDRVTTSTRSELDNSDYILSSL